MENTNNNTNKRKIFIVIILFLFIIVLGIILFLFVFNKNNKEDNKVMEQQNIIKQNTNESINEVKTLKGLTFESTKIIYQSGSSILTTKVTNNDDVEYTKEIFNIIIKDKDNNIIIRLPGSIAGGISPKESRIITSAVNLDLSSNAYYIEYEEDE